MITTQDFEKLYNQLNPSQKKAVDTVEGAVMVIAGPGTGKTQILTLRIANILLKTQINPENILALTFTEAAVYEMRKRLVSIIGTPGYRVELNTFHGFCNEVIQNNSENFQDLIAAESISELEQIQIIEEIIASSSFELLKPVGDINYYVRPSLAAINDLKKEGVTVKTFAESLLKLEKDFKNIPDLYHEKTSAKGKMKTKYQDELKNIQKNKELLSVYEQYQNVLTKRKLYDFNDMLLKVIEALQKDEELLLRLQEKYQYFLVDEHQDTNTAQNKIIELLAGFYENPNLFVVGDEKQAIFRFQGASLENFLYFKTLYKEAVLINLTHNYRSTQHILNAAGSLIANNPKNEINLQEYNLTATAEYPNEQIKVMTFHDYYAEFYWMAEDIQKKISTKEEDPCDVAVLIRNNRDAEPIVDALEHLKIPYIIETDMNVLHDIEIEKVLLLLRLLHSIGDDTSLIKAMHIDTFHINPLDIYKLMVTSHQNKESMWDLISQPEKYENLELESIHEIQSYYEKILRWKTKSENESFDDVFVTVVNDSGLMESILTKKNALDILDKISVLYGEIKIRLSRDHLFNLEKFLQYIDLLTVHNLSIKKTPNNGHKKAVRIMTAHKSKGLEFDYVYIPQSYDGHWGNQRKRGASFTIPWEQLSIHFDIHTSIDRNEDERRLFYVALTRAKKEVYITLATSNLEGREQVPSQFVSEIESSYQVEISTKEFETEFEKNKQIVLLPKDLTKPEIMKREYTENKKFFQDLFAKRGLSVSGLNNYLNCPWKYFYRNLLSLPDVKDLSAIFGTAIHKALNRYLSLYNKAQGNLDYLLQEYQKALEEQAITQTEIDRLLTKGNAILPGYFNDQMIHWKSDMKSEMNIRGVPLKDGVILNGRIDMIEPTGVTQEYIVHDFKTSKPMSRNEIEGKTFNATGDYKRQLVFYKILLDRYQKGRMKMVEGVIDFVQPTDRGVYKKESFIIQDNEVEELEETIIRVADEIMNLSFWDKECEDKNCEYCALRKLIG